MVKPNIYFIGVGAPRSGTSWLVECLREHPELYIPVKKELNFFSKKRPNLGGKSLYDLKGIKGYYKNFNRSFGKKSGEFTPNYMYSIKTMNIIKNNFKDIKIIFCLRNPVERYISHYNFHVTRGKKPEFKKYLEKGLYYKYLKKWLNSFPKKNIKVILYEDIQKNPDKVLRELFSFLEVNKDVALNSKNKRINTSGVEKSKMVSFLIKKLITLAKIFRKLHLDFLVNFIKIYFGNYVNKMYWKNIKPKKI
jgi:hypothetical protein